MSDSAAIATHGLSKDFGSGRGLFDLDLEVQRGEVFGFLGPNGAGKSTTMRLLLDLIRPTAGSPSLLGLDAHADSLVLRRRIGYLAGDFGLYPRLSGAVVLDYLGELRGGVDRRRRDALAERFGADLHRPIRELTETSAQGGTIFLSSHTLSEVERVTHRLAILREGRLVVVDSLENLRRIAVQRLEIEFADPPPPAAVFEALPGVRGVTGAASTLTVAFEGSADAVVKAAAAPRGAGRPLARRRPRRSSCATTAPSLRRRASSPGSAASPTSPTSWWRRTEPGAAITRPLYWRPWRPSPPLDWSSASRRRQR